MAYDIYQIEVRHEGLNKYRLIRGRNPYAVQQTAAALKASWDETWEKKQQRESAIREKEGRPLPRINRMMIRDGKLLHDHSSDNCLNL